MASPKVADLSPSFASRFPELLAAQALKHLRPHGREPRLGTIYIRRSDSAKGPYSLG